ncbi:Flp family type IVb pilin [Parerythrobacter jejuensis]|uniref:Flp family type IVb pilin n=1 Tax=Parerythrobacter jejuensis TaxID=795812 RepID=A0A845AP29_9SPHN|nr:Flp family type IVb pilin [Parerythrobacter jejuensis]MXP31364.1 Flp family type IVb pilin [Parerythrobacter jejuensis]MXP34124.1 Flp family type IVb pilin [Parerythrobacter jejuensis]
MFKKILQDETGSPATEFALVASIISIAALGAFMALGNASTAQMDGVEQAYADVN